jgi:hypothetical protein
MPKKVKEEKERLQTQIISTRQQNKEDYSNHIYFF